MVDANAASSTAPAVTEMVVPTATEQRAEWLKTGKLPEPTKKEESSTSSESPAAAESESASASETDTQQEQKEVAELPQRKESAAEKRIRNLVAEKKSLEDRLRTLEQGKEKQPEAKTSPKETVAEDKEAPKEPQPEDYNSLADYHKAMTKWSRENADYASNKAVKDFHEKQQQKAAQAEVDKRNKEIADRFQKQVDAAKKEHADFEDVVDGVKIPEGSVLDAFLVDSEQGAKILYRLASKPEELARIVALGPLAQGRALYQLEQELGGTATSQPAPAKKISNAPAPTSEVAARGTTPEDEAVDAVKRGDFAAYKRTQTARDLKNRKG